MIGQVNYYGNIFNFQILKAFHLECQYMEQQDQKLGNRLEIRSIVIYYKNSEIIL